MPKLKCLLFNFILKIILSSTSFQFLFGFEKKEIFVKIVFWTKWVHKAIIQAKKLVGVKGISLS